MDSTLPGAAARGFDAHRRGWEAKFGPGLPTFDADTTDDFRVKAHAVLMDNVFMVDIDGASGISTAHPLAETDKEIQLYVVSRGAYTLPDSSGRSAHTVSAGQFLLQHFQRPPQLDMAPGTTAKVVVTTPSPALAPLLRNRMIAGPADSAELRLLLAHAEMVRATIADLGPAGMKAAGNALLELLKGVALGHIDDVEPRLTPALTQAAKNLADRRLADPELSPTALARELNVSIRTLQRAFAAEGASIAAYIQHRRLEEARLALTAPNHLSVSELAAYWQFADRSHFIRAFKRAYGQTPTQYARATT
ncbi:helix-turn-helix domain-containing protein [Nocardia sp. NPDC051321]|uniref:helix-turn-helix domain-containing protein n=1 Tax=Nocardia sp. NPDC051321 TaxID=3364323 RepID=UPI0037935F4D